MKDNPYSSNQTHEQFLEQLDESFTNDNIIAEWFNDNGFKVYVTPKKRANSYSEAEDRKSADDGDFYFENKQGWRKGEVKSWPDIDFKSKEDIPYPNVIVNAIRSWEDADPKPVVHFILNKSKTHAIQINSDTNGNWFKKEVWDKRKGGKRWFYFVPKELVSVVKIEKEKYSFFEGVK